MSSKLADLSALYLSDEQTQRSVDRYDRFEYLLKKARTGSKPLNKAVRFLERTVREDNMFQLYYFGGFLRDLWLGRDPRDIDIVINDYGKNFENVFGKFVQRRNKFGGYKLNILGCSVDAWEIANTYSFKEQLCLPASPSRLPETTFFNVESIVLEVWSPGEGLRWGWDGGFFKACETKTLDLQGIQSLSNPFPALQLARTYNLQKKLGWKIGPKLGHFIKENLPKNKEYVQEFFLKHYGENINMDSLIDTLTSLANNANPKT
jgi:hypothetical protein